MKIGLLTHVLPDMPSGQGMVLGRVLGGLAPDEVVVIGSPRAGRRGARTAGPFAAHVLPSDLPPRFARAALPAATLLRARRVAAILRRERCDRLVACTGDLLDLPAGALAARWTGILFYAYLFDDYLYQWRTRWERLFARPAEAAVMRAAAGVIAPNEFLRDEYLVRHGVHAAVVRNPHPYRRADLCGASGPVAVAEEDRLCYTGAVYDVNSDAIRTLLNALSRARRGPHGLDIYTAQAPDVLVCRGITGPVAVRPYLANEEALAVQRAAGALYLPLGFAPAVRGIVRTAAPGKLGEYLASRRPVLVHAPPDTFVAWYARKHDCALVVDENRAEILAAAIERLGGDPELRCRLAANALARACDDFALDTAQGQFREAVACGVAR